MRPRRAVAGLAVLTAAAVAISSCAPAPPAGPRLVLVYATCSLNKQLLSPYDPAVTYTPQIGAFADEAVVFERHTSEAGQSGIAYAALYTGVHADRHLVYRHPTKIPDEVETLSEAFRDRGFDTYFWDHHPMARRGLNYAQGVDWDHVFAPPEGGRARERTGVTGDSPEFLELLAGLREDPRRRALVISNNSVPHHPYVFSLTRDFRAEFPREVPDLDWQRARELYDVYFENRLQLQNNFDETVERLGLTGEQIATLSDILETAYKAQLHWLDDLFGGVLGAIRESGLWDDSLIVFTSDHGEVLYRDNALFKWTHGYQLAPEVLDIALIVRGPDPALRGGRFGAVTRSTDVLPTLLGLAGLRPLADVELQGVDLGPALLGREEPPRLLAYSHSSVVGRSVAAEVPAWTTMHRFFPGTNPAHIWVRIRDRDMVYKYRNLDGTRWGVEVFDHAVDPEERTNLFDDGNSEHLRMKRELESYRRRLVTRYRHYEHSRQKELLRTSPEEELEALKALGYVNG